MDFNLFRRRGEKIVAVADIGSASAGIALIAVQKGKPAYVLGANRAILPPEKRKEDALIAGIGEMILEAGRNVLEAYARDRQKDPGPVKELYAVVHAPWTHAKSVGARAKFEESTRITGHTISHLAQEALASETGFDRKNFLEASVAKIQLNGYSTNAPEGKWAHEVALTGLVSDCDPRMRSVIETNLGQVFPHMRPAFRSSTRALLSALRGYMPIKEYVAIDMTGEATGIIVVREGIVDKELSTPEGMHTILRRFSEKGMPEETLSLMHMLEREHCDTEACETLKTSIGRIEPELVRLFGEGMAKLASPQRLPAHLALVAHADMSPWLSRFFSRIDFTQFTQTAQPFIVHELAPKDLADFVVSEHDATPDIGLVVASALVDKEVTGG